MLLSMFKDAGSFTEPGVFVPFFSGPQPLLEGSSMDNSLQGGPRIQSQVELVHPCKWPKIDGLTGVISLLIRVITSFITGSGAHRE